MGEGGEWGGEGRSLASGSQATVRSVLQTTPIVCPSTHTTPSSLPNSWLLLPTSPDSALHPRPAPVMIPGPPCLIPAELLPRVCMAASPWTGPRAPHASPPLHASVWSTLPSSCSPHCAPGMGVLSSNWSSICLDTGSSPLSLGEPHLQPRRDPQAYLGLDLSPELEAAVTWTRPAAGRP